MAKEKKEVPRAALQHGQNSWFTVKLAWTHGEKKVVTLSLLSAVTAVAMNLLNLYVSYANIGAS